jgi:radical SAM superfamily enzyme YgiQ (UPF0313 family)
MQKHALIINPWVTDFKLYDEWMHPVGLYFLISLLQHNKWETYYINCLERAPDSKPKRHSTGAFPDNEIQKPPLFQNINRRYKRYGISKNNLLDKLSEVPKPDIIFLGTGMTYWADGVIETFDTVRKAFPQTPVVIGGIAASLITDFLQRSFPNALIYTGPISDAVNRIPQLENISLNGWTPSIIEALKLQSNHFHGVILTSLGCPFQCSYCASTHLQSNYYSRDHDIVFNEIKHLIDNCSLTDFAFYDDALLYQPEKNFLPLADKLSTLNNKIKLHTPNGLHIRWLNSKILDAMHTCGFHTLRFGYETSDKKLQKETNYKTNRKELAEKIMLSKAAGFKPKNIGIYIMAGLPDQTIEDVLEELSFIASLGVIVKPVFLSPVPHTPLFDHYAGTYPQLKTDPHFHNDTFFITQLQGWDYSCVEEVKGKARELNILIYQ